MRYPDTISDLVCWQEWAFRNHFSSVDFARNYRYVNDNRIVVQRYHLSKKHLHLDKKFKWFNSIRLKGCRIAWERPELPTKVAALN